MKGSRKAEGRDRGVQAEKSVQVRSAPRGRDATAHTVLALFFPGLRGEAGRVMPLPGPPGADGLPGSPGFQGPQGTFRVLLHLEIELEPS